MLVERTYAMAAGRDGSHPKHSSGAPSNRLAARKEIVITRLGRPAGVLIGLASDNDWFEYRLEHHPEFLRRVAVARTAIREGRGILVEELDKT